METELRLQTRGDTYDECQQKLGDAFVEFVSYEIPDASWRIEISEAPVWPGKRKSSDKKLKYVAIAFVTFTNV